MKLILNIIHTIKTGSLTRRHNIYFIPTCFNPNSEYACSLDAEEYACYLGYHVRRVTGHNGLCTWPELYICVKFDDMYKYISCNLQLKINIYLYLQIYNICLVFLKAFLVKCSSSKNEATADLTMVMTFQVLN